MPTSTRWLNRTVLGISLASLFSDWSHEIATAMLPAYLALLEGTPAGAAGVGAAAAWLGIIEGVSDGLSSFAKMASGYYTDRLRRRKPIAVLGYVVTALGTASFALASHPWHLLVARASAWLGRGVRTPVRKALLAAAVTPATYGRAFGFERMMDTLGAIVGPASAVALMGLLHHDYPRLFALTLLPGLLAAVCIGLLVQEKERKRIAWVTFREGLAALPGPFRRFLVAVGLFGCGDFAHSMLILLATQQLAPGLGHAAAASVAVGLYLLHNGVYAASALVAGWLSDRWNRRLLLASGYFAGAVMAIAIVLLPPAIWSYAVVFTLGGILVGVSETGEDALAADLVDEAHHGMGFGVLATVNGIGDTVSSVAVGLLWASLGLAAAFGYCALLFVAAAVMLIVGRDGRKAF